MEKLLDKEVVAGTDFALKFRIFDSDGSVINLQNSVYSLEFILVHFGRSDAILSKKIVYQKVSGATTITNTTTLYDGTITNDESIIIEDRNLCTIKLFPSETENLYGEYEYMLYITYTNPKTLEQVTISPFLPSNLHIYPKFK